MNITYGQLYSSFILGAKNIIANQTLLNSINVFPVADGDTGTNLSETVKNMVRYLSKHNTIKEVFKSASHGAFVGAHGNSGIIFAKFIDFCAKEMPNIAEISFREFAANIKTAVDNLYQYMLNPVEGTILTMMRAWSNYLQSYDQFHRDEDFIRYIVSSSYHTLTKTPEMLPILKKKGVVDSGAQGFFFFLEMFTLNLSQKKTIRAETVIPTLPHDFNLITADSPEDNKYRYCCEFLLKHNQSIQPNSFLDLGGSIAVLEREGYTKIHIHSDQPSVVNQLLQKQGDIVEEIIDDMWLQHSVIQRKKSPIAVVTDSIADLSDEFILDHQVFVLPLRLELCGSSYLDKVTITPRQFSQLNEKNSTQPKSSLPSLSMIEHTLDFIMEHYDKALIITVSSQLSGTNKALRQLVQKYSGNGKQLQVIDSKLNSGAQGLLVKKAVSLLGHSDNLEEVSKTLISHTANIKILVALDTTKYLARSGRVSNTMGKFFELLHFKPIMSLDDAGNGIAYGASFSQKGAIRKIIKALQMEHKKSHILRYTILHANDAEAAKLFGQEIEKAIALAPDELLEISPIVEATAGRGALAVAYEVRGCQQ